MKGNDDSDNKNEIMQMAPATERVLEQGEQPSLESLCRRHRALVPKAQKQTHKSEGSSNQSFIGKSLLQTLRKQAARSQATKDRVSGMTGKAAPKIFYDET